MRVDELLDNFNWERVKATREALGWKPELTFSELRLAGRDLLWAAVTDTGRDTVRYDKDGMQAIREGDLLTLQFIVAETEDLSDETTSCEFQD